MGFKVVAGRRARKAADQVARRVNAENRLRDPKVHAGNALRNLPDGVDPSLAADAAMTLADSPWHFARTCQRFRAPVIRATLERLAPAAGDAEAAHRLVAIIASMLVDPAIDDHRLVERWHVALQALLDLNTSYGWGSRGRRQKIRGLAGDPEVLGALHAVAVGCQDAPLDVLAVLCADGSNASLDALLPHVDRGENDDPRLTSLLRLRTHANPDRPAVGALLDRLEARLSQRSDESPARDLARRIGVGEPAVFWFHAWISSLEKTVHNVSLYQAHVTVDSRESVWFRVSITRVDGFVEFARTMFNAAEVIGDGLGLGRCDAPEIPAWFARAAQQLGAEWRVGLRSNMRGAKRERISAWLLSA